MPWSSANSTSDPRKRRWRWIHAGMLVAAAGIFLIVRDWGERLSPPGRISPSVAPIGTAESAARASDDRLFHIFLAMVVVIVASRSLALLCRPLRQPRVVAEIMAGILLGPSLLGWLWPSAYAYLLPVEIVPFLQLLAQLGIILYMFLVGLELNTGLLRERSDSMIAVSHASMVVPFILGLVLALWVYPRLAPGGVPFTVFALFFAVSLSVTAFPVLARILAERGLSRTGLGAMALACAAVNDVTAWCVLAFVIGVVQAKIGGAVLTLALTAVFLAVMYCVVRPVMSRLVQRHDSSRSVTQGAVAFVFVALLLSSLATELIGIHAIFGAFLLGAVIPHDSRIAREFLQRLEDLVAILLLPAFFALTGMRTEIRLVSGWHEFLLCVVIIVVATLGKFGGSAMAGRLTGMSWRDAASVGVLMNTRGLMELIVLNTGLDLGVISPVLFTMLVLMALATTGATGPILESLVERSPSTPNDLPRGRKTGAAEPQT